MKRLNLEEKGQQDYQRQLAPRKDKSRFGTFNYTNKGISFLLNVYNCVED